MKIIITEQQLKKIAEGVGDKYLENKFGFEPEFADFEKKYTQQQMPDEPIAYITDIPIYKNPKSLDLFDANVRAIADKEGDLYVALHDGNFYHGMMAHAIGLAHDPNSIYKSLKNIMLLHRVGKTNSFGMSDTNIREIWRYEPNYIEIMNKMKSINPAYKIHLRYYGYVHED
jgi:hypothetical protein